MSIPCDAHALPSTLSETAVIPRFSWGAVFAGLAAAIAVNIVLAQAWLGVGLLLVDRDSHPGTVIITSAIAWVLSACAALFAGGWVAGRVGQARDRTVGVLQGASVWATAAIVGVLLAVSAAGTLIGGSAHLVSQGLQAAATVAGDGAKGIAQVVAPNLDGIRKELGDVVARRSQNTPDAANALDNRLANGSRLTELMSSHFTMDGKRMQTDAEQAELVTLISSEAGISQEAAAKALAQWDRVWANSVAQWKVAKEEALQAAEATRKVTAQAACWSVIALALGALAAIGGGACGVACRRHALAHQQPSHSSMM